ncbi:hypothetical protein BASA81_007397 [Batrachochytrium salamandrivorans]|nr:hypothetical protein BASA81_007397 [Batrachochytrium salamandrivorans]
MSAGLAVAPVGGGGSGPARSKIDRLMSAEDPEDVMERGVSYDFLAKLLHKQKLHGLTTREVVHTYIIPQTYNSRCSLSGLLRVMHPQSVGRATHYILHAWDCSFDRLVRTIQVLDAGYDDYEGNPPYFWLDVFALNQRQQAEHHRLDEESKWIQRDKLFAGLKSTLRLVPHVRCVCDPVHRPKVLERRWCLFEMALAISLKQDVALCAVPEPPDFDPFMVVMDPNFEQDYGVDFAQSQSTSSLDAEWLGAEALTLSPLGQAFVNDQVQSLFLLWIANRLAGRVLVPGFLDFMEDRAEMEDKLRVMHKLSQVLAKTETFEGIQLAREILSRAMARADKLWGSEMDETLSMMHDFACLIARGFKELKPADVMLRKVLHSRTVLFGQEHYKVVETSEALGLVLKERRKLTEAISLFRFVVGRKEITLGRSHSDTLKSLNHLGLTLQKKELYGDAEVILKRVVVDGTEVLGPGNLDVMIWSNNLSMLYQDTKQLELAELLLRVTLRHAESGLGPFHAHTLTLVFNLGFVLWQQGRYRLAEQMFRRELAACESAKGQEHKDTVKSRRNLERFLEERELVAATTTSTVATKGEEEEEAGESEEEGEAVSLVTSVYLDQDDNTEPSSASHSASMTARACSSSSSLDQEDQEEDDEEDDEEEDSDVEEYDEDDQDNEAV